jgi:hypothetical protein
MSAESLRTTSTVAQFLAYELDRSSKTQRAIGAEIGYGNSNIITMFKQGLTRVPIAVAPKLAQALGIDPIHFLRMCMNEYMPETLVAIEETLGALPTRNESRVLEILREVHGRGECPSLTHTQEAALRSVFAEFSRPQEG